MSPVTALLASTAAPTTSAPPPRPARPSLLFSPVPGRALAVECSSRPQKKATKHHIKSRPKKTQPWDIKRRPTQYPPLPQLPPDWTLVAAGPSDAATPAEEVEVELVAAAAD